MESLRKMQTKESLIGDVRGFGLFIGIEIVDSWNLTPVVEGQEPPKHGTDQADFIVQHMREEANILVSTDGPKDNVLKVKPPICWTQENANQFLAAFANALVACRKHFAPNTLC